MCSSCCRNKISSCNWAGGDHEAAASVPSYDIFVGGGQGVSERNGRRRMVRSSADKTHARFKIPGGLQNTRNINQHLLSSNRLQKAPLHTRASAAAPSTVSKRWRWWLFDEYMALSEGRVRGLGAHVAGVFCSWGKKDYEIMVMSKEIGEGWNCAGF